MPLDFREIASGEAFEQFTAELLRELGFRILRNAGRGPDGGVDLVVESPKDATSGFSLRLLVQCKHFAHSGRAVGLPDLGGISLNDLVEARNAAGLLLICSTIPSQSLLSHLDALSTAERRPFTVWDRNILEAKLVALSSTGLLQRVFPRSAGELASSILLPTPVAKWSTIVQTLLACARSDIAGEIGKKYIPDLYVTRPAVQDTIDNFIRAAQRAGAIEKSIEEADQISKKAGRLCKDMINALVKSTLPQIDLSRLRNRANSTYSTAAHAVKQAMEAAKQLHNTDSELRALDVGLADLARIFKPEHLDRVIPREQIVPTLHREQERLASIIGEFRALGSPLQRLLALCSTELIETDTLKESIARATIRPQGHEDLAVLQQLQSEAQRLNAGVDSTLEQLNLADKVFGAISHNIKPAIMLIEKAGRGKTNLACDLVARFGIEAPVFFVAAKALPLSNPNPLLDRIMRRLDSLPGLSGSSGLDVLAQYAHMNRSQCIIVVDGINESVDPFLFAVRLQEFLSGLRYLPVRVVLTCREEYAAVFAGSSMHVGWELVGELGVFTQEQTSEAIHRYFEHYAISCAVARDALQALSDPLLLRFFCEAYSGRAEALGDKVTHIRLKNLFDEYKQQKYHEIIAKLGNRFTHEYIDDYLDRIALRLLESQSASVDRMALERAIPREDLATVGSLYSLLLDADIVIEQRFEKERSIILMNFTYEAFMEYSLAKCVMNDVRLPKQVDVPLALNTWMQRHKGFPNWIGVMGFLLVFIYEWDIESFERAVEWVDRSGDADLVRALAIGLNNLPPQGFSQTVQSVLARHLDAGYKGRAKASPGQKQHGEERTLSSEECVALFRRCPMNAGRTLLAAIRQNKIKLDAGPIEWWDILTHFESVDPEIRWELWRLRFMHHDPLRRLRRADIHEMKTWVLGDSGAWRCRSAKTVAKKIVSSWNTDADTILHQRRFGSERAAAMDEFVAAIQSGLHDT